MGPDTSFIKISVDLGLTLSEARLGSLCLMGSSDEDISQFTGWEKDKVKKAKTRLRDRMGVPTPQSLDYHLHKAGFDFHGCVKGQPIFTAGEARVLKRLMPWVRIEKTREAALVPAL